MNYSLTVSLPVSRGEVQGTTFRPSGLAGLGGSCLLYTFICLVHVLDVALQHEQIRSVDAIHFQSAAIVPLNRTFDFFTIKQDDHHWGMRIDLFFVVKNLCTGFERRRYPLTH